MSANPQSVNDCIARIPTAAEQAREDRYNDLMCALHVGRKRRLPVYAVTDMEAEGYGDFYAARDRNDAVQQARHNDGREDAERNNARWSVELVATVEEVMDDSITDTEWAGRVLSDDAEGDLRAAQAEAKEKGWTVYRLSCAGFRDTYEAASHIDRAWPRARSRGWARGGGSVTTKPYEPKPTPQQVRQQMDETARRVEERAAEEERDQQGERFDGCQ